MIRVIIDTNVLMSGVFWSGAPAKILDAWQQKKIKMVISPDVLDEYIRVGHILANKYPGVDINQYRKVGIIKPSDFVKHYLS
jgi:putative PIN family toxin of toxin-antitoxin system